MHTLKYRKIILENKKSQANTCRLLKTLQVQLLIILAYNIGLVTLKYNVRWKLIELNNNVRWKL